MPHTTDDNTTHISVCRGYIIFIKSKTHQHEHERYYAYDESRDDIHKNSVTVHTPIDTNTNAMQENRRKNETREKNVTILKVIALPIALVYAHALVCFGNDQIMPDNVVLININYFPIFSLGPAGVI